MTSINSITTGMQTQGIAFKANVENLKSEPAVSDKTVVQDSYVSSKGLSKEAKQEIMKSANTTASGWAVFGGLISTLYFGLRSNKTIADKYGLDVEKDKQFINGIKKQQMLWTLPTFILYPVGGIVAWLYNKNTDAASINV